MATLALETDQPNLLDLFEEERSTAPVAVPVPAAAPVAAPAAPAGAGASAPARTEPFGERTLEDLVLGAWEELAVAPTTSCPLCAGPLLPRFGAGARPVGARCSGCATELG